MLVLDHTIRLKCSDVNNSEMNLVIYIDEEMRHEVMKEMRVSKFRMVPEVKLAVNQGSIAQLLKL